MRRQRTILVVGTAIAAGALAACAVLADVFGNPTTIPTPQPTVTAAPTSQPTSAAPTSRGPSPSSTSSTSASPTKTAPPNPTDPYAAVPAEISSYYRVLDELGQDPKQKIQRLSTISRGEAYYVWRVEYTKWRSEGWKSTGSAVVTSVKVEKQDKKNGRRRAAADICVNVSKVKVKDKDGKSVVAKDRADVASATLLLEEDDGEWYVLRHRIGKHTCA